MSEPYKGQTATPQAATRETAAARKAPTARKPSTAGKAAAGKAKRVIDKTADKLSAGVKTTSARSQVAAQRASDGIQNLADRVDPFVTGRPYAALGAGVAAGLLIGFILGRPRVIYVKPRP